MIIRGISIRSKLQLTTLVTVALMVFLSLVIMDASNRMGSSRELLNEQSALISRARTLEQSFYSLVKKGGAGMHATCIKDARRLETVLASISRHPFVEGEQELVLSSLQITSSLQILLDELSHADKTDSTAWNRAETELQVLGVILSDFNTDISSREEGLSRNQRRQLAITLALGIFFIGLFLIHFTLNLSRVFLSLLTFTRELTLGILPPPIGLIQNDEMGQIATDLNTHTADLRDKINYISSLSGKGPVANYEPGEEDEVGSALLVLSKYLISKELDEISRNRDDKKKNWISNGMAQIGDVLRSEREDVAKLSFSIIQKLVNYMDVEMGALFIANHSDPAKPILELSSSYAYDRRKYKNGTLEWGSGLPGTCAQEQKLIFLTEVPEDYFEVSSGTGSARPNCLLLVPMIIEDTVYGIIELATVRLLRPFEINFVESLAEGIASSLLAVKTNERTTELLKQSQAQADALKNQEITMKENMRQLEEAQAESGKKESEITGILNAINHSTLVAELGLNGRYTSINDRFLMLLASQRDQVLGKLYTEFSQADPSSGEYKEFWASLKEGKSASNTELYKLVSGKEIWLRQTFTPIINKDGRVYKILNIAEDISETRDLQKLVEESASELTRTGLDMQTLNEAVNSTLIKCELDPEGIIVQVNEKYCEITGYSRKELLGRNYRLFLKASEKEQFEKIWNEVSKQKVYEGVIRRSKPTDEEAWLVSTFSPVIDEAGVIYKVYLMGLDITEKKLKYQLLEDANQEIERLKQEFKERETG